MGVIKINRETDCWVWLGSCDGVGRPLTYHKGVPKRVQHLYFEQEYKYNPRRIKTNCNTKFCCNPKHLVDATANAEQERIKRMIAKMNLDDDTRKALQS